MKPDELKDAPWLATGLLPPHVANKIGNISPTGCWLWAAAKTNGYGVVWHNGKLRRAHRVVYEILVGPIVGELEGDHLCGYEGEHEMPRTWRMAEWKASGGYGARTDNQNKHRERLWLSPACLAAKQGSLFECTSR
jgi:hypothetical protein